MQEVVIGGGMPLLKGCELYQDGGDWTVIASMSK